MVTEPEIKARFEMLAPFLDERTRRLAAAAEAASIGRGGVSRVARATGVSRRAITSGLAQLQAPDASGNDRVRQVRPEAAARGPWTRTPRSAATWSA